MLNLIDRDFSFYNQKGREMKFKSMKSEITCRFITAEQK